GEISGANVQIASGLFIRAADSVNLLSVNGDLVLDSQISDLSTGTEAPDISFLDAASVLSGQCAQARSTGRSSRFSSRPTGPYSLVFEPSIQTRISITETEVNSNTFDNCARVRRDNRAVH